MRAEAVVPHSKMREIELKNHAWVRQYNLAATPREILAHERIRTASFASHTYSYASMEIALLGADLISWLFLFDDVHGESGNGTTLREALVRYATYERAARTGVLPQKASNFHRAIVDVAERGETLANRAWRDRFADSLSRYFDGCVLERPHRAARMPPAISDYRGVRSWSVGAYPPFDLIELATGLLTESETVIVELDDARERAALLCAWVNDVYSMPKEAAAGDPLNLVAVLSREYNINIAEAFSAATRVYNADLERFEQVRDNWGAGGCSVAVSNYLDGLTAWIHGNYAWTGECGRYHPSVANAP
jgi:Terpene synthase family 2, C-terminal metal binding